MSVRRRKAPAGFPRFEPQNRVVDCHGPNARIEPIWPAERDELGLNERNTAPAPVATMAAASPRVGAWHEHTSALAGPRPPQRMEHNGALRPRGPVRPCGGDQQDQPVPPPRPAPPPCCRPGAPPGPVPPLGCSPDGAPSWGSSPSSPTPQPANRTSGKVAARRSTTTVEGPIFIAAELASVVPLRGTKAAPCAGGSTPYGWTLRAPAWIQERPEHRFVNAKRIAGRPGLARPSLATRASPRSRRRGSCAAIRGCGWSRSRSFGAVPAQRRSTLAGPVAFGRRVFQIRGLRRGVFGCGGVCAGVAQPLSAHRARRLRTQGLPGPCSRAQRLRERRPHARRRPAGCR